MFIYDSSKQYKNKYSPCVLLKESYRNEKGQPRNRTVLNLSKLPENIRNSIIATVKGGTNFIKMENISSTKSKTLGEVFVLYKLIRRTGLEKILIRNIGKISTPLVIAMIVNRLSNPKSRYSLKSWLENTWLPQILQTQLKDFHHNKLYEALKQLSSKQEQIENDLWKTNTKNKGQMKLFLYDISSSYVEGKQNEYAAFGYNRDGKKGKKQIVIGLVTTETGLPITVEIFNGNTSDATTLEGTVRNIQERFKIKDVVYVFDRGMHDKKKRTCLRTKDIKYLTALKRREIKDLRTKEVIQIGLFDKEIAEYKKDSRRYLVCKSDVERKNNITLDKLLLKTEKELEKAKNSITKGRLKDPVKISARTERILSKWKMKKYFDVSIESGQLEFSRRQKKIEEAKLLNSIYVLETTENEMTKKELQESYKKLAKVERDFRITKSTLKVRPINHRKKETVRGHVFICFLALYIRREFENKARKERKLDKYTIAGIQEKLKGVNQSVITIEEKEIPILEKTTDIQKQILKTLGVKLSVVNL